MLEEPCDANKRGSTYGEWGGGKRVDISCGEWEGDGWNYVPRVVFVEITFGLWGVGAGSKFRAVWSNEIVRTASREAKQGLTYRAASEKAGRVLVFHSIRGAMQESIRRVGSRGEGKSFERYGETR